ncbi:MAG: hypothetical protein R8G66_27510 [Cytophagales bacterium]|nr:hypothetical protein [Cytophagales bacterium]
MNNRAICHQALKLDKEGDWQGAHDLVDQLGGQDAAWVHAYLHRKEGDQWNADYWYRRAGQSSFSGSLDEEWEQLWELFSD